MRNLSFGVILGLLAFVHSTPLTTVTQISAKDEVVNEALTDGFLIDLPSLTTASPKRNTTVPVSQPSSSVPTESDFEGSALGESSDLFHQHEGEHPATTTQSVSHPPSSTSTVFLRAVDHSSSDLSITQSTQASFKSSSVPNEAQPSYTPDHKSTSQTTRHAVRIFDPLTSDLGSGDGEMPEQYTTTTSSMNSNTNGVTDAASSTIMATPIGPKRPRMFLPNDELVVVNKEPQTGPSGHKTPGWMIITGFIVGVAALVVICVAIATRDKWNAPSKASQLETQTNSTNQQREQEQEMETFLPKENGKAAEYTVIPLDELPENNSSD
ncbi:mucin-17-like [Labrus bergylta]|uniref:mucin-17-like n=1 Tax=Labrus bergylta TaxID=56723 RepID=UPI003313E5D4